MSIGRKFTLCVLGTLLIIMAVSVFFYSQFELREEKRKMEPFTRMTGRLIEESIAAIMLDRKAGGLDEKLMNIKEASDVIGTIWLLNRDGVVRNSTDRTTIGTRLNLPVAGNVTQSRSFFLNGGKTYRLVQPVENGPSCRGCHGSTAKYNGTIVIDFSMINILGHVHKEIYRAASIMLVTLILTGGAVLVLWNILVNKRLNSAIENVRRVQEGSYHSAPQPEGRDEFARLEHDFNRMAEAIQARDGEKESLVSQLSVANEELLQEIRMRKQWEARLREQKTFSDNLIQNSAVATFVLDSEHRIIIWNKACEILTGFPASEMVGTDGQWKPFYRRRRETLADLVLDGRADLADRYPKHSASTLIANGLHAEGWYEQLNGKDRYIIFDAAPVLDSKGEQTAVIETLQDVTAQKNMEEALTRSEAQLRTVIETEPECVKLTSADGTILEINKAGLAMLEADTPDAVVGKPLMPFIVSTHMPAVRAHMAKVLGGMPDTLEFELVGLKGSRRWVETCAAPLRNGREEIFALLSVTRDVTERKQWEKKLQEQLRFQRVLMDTIPMPVFYKDANGVYQGCNKAFENYLGRPKENIIGKTVYDIAPKELADEYFRRDVELFQNPGVQSYEFPVNQADGTQHEVLFNKATFTDASGKVAGMLGVMHDITERKKAESALRESEARFRELAGLLPQPVYEADLNGAITFGNRSAFDYFGFLPKELGRITIADMIVPEDRDRVRKNLENLLRGAQPAGHEYMAMSKDGTKFPVIVYSAPVIRNEKSIGFRGIIMDITERKKAEEAVLQTNEALQTLVNASPIPIMVLDTNGKITVWNPASERIFGWSACEVIGQSNPIVPEHKKEEFRRFQDRVMRGEAFTAIELQRQKKDGNLIDVSLSAAPLRDAYGKIIGILGLLTDITERKQADEVIRRHYDTQTAINWILHISLENMPLDKILKQALDLILSIPWLSIESCGAVFLVGNDPETLVMKAQRGLSEHIQKECAEVPFGKCHCGNAAARGEVQFSDALDHRHIIKYEGIEQHGHYCIPIRHARTVLGVINIYLKKGHVRDQREIEFLSAIADALAGIIRRSRAEAALQESEKRYRTLAEAAHDVIFILNREGGIEYVNSFGAGLFGRTAQEIVGKNSRHLFPPDISDRQWGNVSKVIETGESVYAENLFSFMNTQSWLGTWLVPLKEKDGAVGSVLGVSRDITERKRSEQEREKLIVDLQRALDLLSHSHKEWQETFDSITDMIAIIDTNFTIVKANKAFAAYFGLHPREVINRKCHSLQHETDSPIPDCPHIRTVREKSAHSGEVVDKRTNRVFRTTTFPYSSPDGEVTGSIHVSRDVTDEKESEMRLIMSERLAALGQMASGIAHEINNPLASIAGCSEGLLTRVRKGKYDYKLFETYLNIIQEEIFRCKSITTAMLSFVRKTTYEKKKVNINEMLDRAVEIISFQGRLKDVTIEKKYRSVSPEVHANEGELRQVFLSVITNALDAMKDAGTLTLETGTNGSTVFARIADSGPGILQENITRIFDPFYTTKSEAGGTGLGLSIAQKIIHNHNGNIEAVSEPGNGCVFTITLPVS